MKDEKEGDVSASVTITVPVITVKATGVVMLPHKALLETSKQLIDQQQYMAAIVIAQTACETFAEVAINAILRDKALDYLDGPISELLPNYNLRNEKVRKLYVALTDDKIQDAPFWVEYTKFVALRNRVVHRGKRPSKQQAEECFKVATEMVEHLEDLLRIKYTNSQWTWKQP